jgi:hypothetical protein
MAVKSRLTAGAKSLEARKPLFVDGREAGQGRFFKILAGGFGPRRQPGLATSKVRGSFPPRFPEDG